MIKRVINRLFVENAPLKAFSLVLAIALVVLVRGERDAVSTTTVKVLWQSPTDRVLMNDPVSDVKIVVSGPLSKVNRLEQRDVPPLRIDLSRVHETEFTFAEKMFELPPGLRVVSITPPSTTLKFDARVAKSVPVRPKIKGAPAPGFMVEGEPAAIPAEVVLEGAKSKIETLEQVDTEVVDIEGVISSATREAQLAGIPRFVEVRASPVVRVAVRVISEPIERVLVGVTVRADPTLIAEPATVEIKVRGPRKEVERLNPKALTATLAEGEPVDGRRRVEITGLPPQVVLLSISPDSVALSPPPVPPAKP